MKELFNTLSSVSEFLKEKRFVYQEKLPPLRKIKPVKPEKTPTTKEIIRGGRLYKEALRTDAIERAELRKAREKRLSSEDKKVALDYLVKQLMKKGPYERNAKKRERIKNDFKRALSRMPSKNQVLALMFKMQKKPGYFPTYEKKLVEIARGLLADKEPTTSKLLAYLFTAEREPEKKVPAVTKKPPVVAKAKEIEKKKPLTFADLMREIEEGSR